MISVTILGNNSASPAHGRHPTSQVVQTDSEVFLIDCGEGTLFQMDTFKIKRSRIKHIFISHLHGDHYFGLIGLINTYGLNQRKTELHIYSPKGLKQIVDIQMETAHARLPYNLHFHELDEDGVLYENEKIEISAFKVHHRIPCFGFLFKEVKNKRKLNYQAVQQHQVPRTYYDKLHEGKDYITPDGQIIPNNILTLPHKKGKSYAFCADTAYWQPICDAVRGADLIYHESTYLKAQKERAEKRFHSTTVQAAAIARKAGVGKLLLGHYSSMYNDTAIFGEEAREVFENTEVSHEGVTYLVK